MEFLENQENPTNNLVCNVCGYVRKPSELQLEYNKSDESKNPELSNDWVCPSCGIKKNELDELS